MSLEEYSRGHSVPRVTRYRQQRSENLPLGIHLLVFCVVVGCFGIWFYELMQPERYPNPGVAAYKPPPATVVLYTQRPRPKDVDTTIAADTLIEPEHEAIDKRALQSAELKSSRESKTVSPKRHHAAPPRQAHNPMTDFAAQPFFFGKPWRWR